MGQSHRERIAQLREQALAHIKGDNAGFSPRSAMMEIEAMGLSDDDQLQPEFLEAKIMMIVGRGKRVPLAQKPLYRLFQSRLIRHEDGVFHEFQDMLKNVGAQGFSVDGLSFFESFATMDHDHVWADTKAAIERVKALIGEAFLNSGTLLGSVREKGLIPHDDDVDLAVLLKAGNAEDAAREWIKVYHTLQAQKLISKPSKRNYGVFKMNSTIGINIDVFPAWIENDRMFVYPHTCGDLAASDVFPLATCATTGLPIPKDAEAMLAVNYGKGWREPDPSFTFNWGRANRRFAAFRDMLAADETVWDVK